MNKLFTISIAIAMIFIAGKTSFTANAQKPDIYVAGSIYIRDNTPKTGEGLNPDYIPEEKKVEHFAFMENYKNGIVQNPEGFYSENASAKSVFVFDDEMFVAGSKNNKATAWKNGQARYLSNGYNSSAESIFVTDDDFYVAGYEQNEIRADVAVLWKNGVPQYLSDGYNDAVASSVYVAGKDVYVVGRKYIPNTRCHVATLWKNGVPKNLTVEKKGAYAEANAVVVSAGNVYVVGCETNTQGNKVAKLWKNGIAKSLSNENNIASAESVFVLGNDVYVVGYEKFEYGNRNVAKLWKNGIAHNLTNAKNEAKAYSVFVIDNDVYVAGYEKNDSNNRIAKLWINGNAISLTDNSIDDATAYSVFLKKP